MRVSDYEKYTIHHACICTQYTMHAFVQQKKKGCDPATLCSCVEKLVLTSISNESSEINFIGADCYQAGAKGILHNDAITEKMGNERSANRD